MVLPADHQQTGGNTDAHTATDVQDAQSLGITAFAINISQYTPVVFLEVLTHDRPARRLCGDVGGRALQSRRGHRFQTLLLHRFYE